MKKNELEKAETCKNDSVSYPGNDALQPAGRRRPSSHQGNKLLPPSFGFSPLFSPRLVALADPKLTISTALPSEPDTMHVEGF